MSGSLRRRGHGLLVVVVAALALGATTVLLAKVFNESDSPGPSWVRAGLMSEVQRQRVVYVPEARAFVVASPSMSPLALYARSPHLGEAVRYCASSGWFEHRPTDRCSTDSDGTYSDRRLVDWIDSAFESSMAASGWILRI